MGGVKCWGGNANGEIGNGSTSLSVIPPTDVSGFGPGAAAISVGYAHTCAVTAAAHGLNCWGANAYGQLGNDSTKDTANPTWVFGLGSGVIAVSAGYVHTCAITSTGKARCWGFGGSGRLGNGSNDEKLKPSDVSDLTSGVTAVSAGMGHTCALTSTGTAKCWGYGGSGQLGDGSSLHSPVPVSVIGFP